MDFRAFIQLQAAFQERNIGLLLRAFQQTLDLTSANEEIQDVQTGHLCVLLLDCWIASLYLESQGDRRILVHKAGVHYDRFTRLLDNYDLIPPHLQKLQILQHSQKAIPIEVRKQMYRRSKEIQHAKDQFHLLMVPTPEQQRDYCMVTIEAGLYTCLQDLESIAREIQMLDYRDSLPPQQPKHQPEQTDQLDRKSILELSGPLMDDSGKPLRPFVITKKQQHDSVFRPSHILPTMSIEEYLDREMERGNFLSSKDQPPPKKHEDEMTLDEQDTELYRVRDFDQFKDDNPKGWGNKGGNIG